MIEISLDFSRAKNLVNGSEIMRRSMAEGAEDSALYVLRRMKKYPRQRTGTSYVRTKTLGRSWHHEVDTTSRWPSARVSSNGNIAPYNRYVQDATRQARMHRSTWRNTAQATAEDSIDSVLGFYRTRIRQNFEI